ncbi:MAG: sulfatase-like hydrolase/transferase [Dongiaceae bacterium]
MLLAAVATAIFSLLATAPTAKAQENPIVHDAQYYILDAQNGERWAAEDKNLDAHLAALRQNYGRPPNIIHLMWDDQPFGAVGIPALQQIRGYSTPRLNQMAAEGMLFTRMYTQPSCTPSRAAAITGQIPVRNGMYKVGFPIEYHGLSKNTVTIASALSKAGYATAFYGKWHLGDIEESYPYNQGYDEAFFAVYNQVVSLWNVQGEAVGATLGLKEQLLARDPYQLNNRFNQQGYVFYIEGKKGELGKEWGATQTPQDYAAFDGESEKRADAFMRQSVADGKPFYMAWWPLWTSFLPDPKKVSLQRGLVGEAYQKVLDPMAGRLVDFLRAQGIAENTLIVAMSDNGPMTHNPPPGAGLGEGIFRGGKGDFTEGAVRVSAQAWWPGTIKPGQTVGDIIDITDLYTTFARIGGATQYLPTDRIIDGLDQTALLLNGDSHGRRDYEFIYLGPNLSATVWKQYKRTWISSGTSASGISASFYDLYNDPREQTPVLVQMSHFSEPFNRMRAVHELWKKKYPDQPAGFGPAFTGLSNARPETLALSKPPIDLKTLPFDPLEYIEDLDRLPFDPNAEAELDQ